MKYRLSFRISNGFEMSEPGRVIVPPDEQNARLRARIDELEQELALHRQSFMSPEQPAGIGAQRPSDQDYKEIFDQLSVCMFFVDVTLDGRFRYAGFNPAEEQVVGLSSAEVAGKFVEEVFAPDLAQKLAGNYRRCLEKGIAITYEDELRFPAGSRYFHTNLIPLRDTSGRIHRIVGACIDTTDLKQALQEAVGRQKLESLGILAAGIAHDFNNLLGSILVEAELAETELDAGGSPKRELQSIQSVASRAAEIVRQLMTYAGKDSARRELVDLSLLMEEMLGLLKVSISKHADLQVDLPRDLPAIWANPAQLRQVIMNLITNASDALNENEGVISISIREVANANSLTDPRASDANARYVRMTVRDSGCGMTPEVLSRIFDPFYTTKFAGRGLGLAAAQGIIRSHDGEIAVSSTPGQGSVFEIQLPCCAQSPGPVSSQMSNQEGHYGSAAGTVLLVEDEGVLRHGVSAILRNAGFHVIEASDGVAGVELFRQNHRMIDVILLDLTLPLMTGLEVLSSVRQIRPDVKVILTSAYSDEGLHFEHAPWGYIRKPYRSNELCQLLLRACQSATA